MALPAGVNKGAGLQAALEDRWDVGTIASPSVTQRTIITFSP